MKTSTLIPVVAYLGLAGYTAAAPVAVDAGHALDKRTFCIFGFGWGCNTAPAPVKPTPAAPSTSTKAVVASSSAVKSSAVASSSAKAVSSAAASSSAKAVVPTSSAVTKTSSANWAACTDFDWNAWGSDWTWGGGFDKDYVKAWYVDQYGFAPPAGMNWRQVSSLVSKFGQKTKPASPKTTSKYTGGKCANPWTSAVNTKTKVPVTTSNAASSSAAPKPVVTSVASSAAASKPVASAPASSAAASSSKAVVASSSSSAAAGPASSSAVVVQPAPSAASSAVVQPAPSASSSAVVQPAPSAASSAAVVQPAPSAASSSAAAPVSASPSPAASSASSAVASPAASSDAASAPAASPSAGTGSSDGGAGVPGTGAGVPGTGAGSNNATGNTTSDAPVATTPAAVVINGFTYGGCAQEVTGRLLDSVQTSSSSQTIEACTALCSSYGYAVAGLEYGNECYCGTLEDIQDVQVSGECYMPCAGNSGEICGGPNAINYYVDADLVPATVELPAGWSTYGVVSEGQNGRLLPFQAYSSNDNTVESCASACANLGYTIAGTEYSAECYCGNAFSASANGGQLLDDSSAFMSCSGNLAQKCGGPSILSVTSAYGNNIPSA